MRFLVTYLDGSEEEVVATASSRTIFEEDYDTSIVMSVISGRSVSAHFLCFMTLQRAGKVDLPVATKQERRESVLAWGDDVESCHAVAPVSELLQLAQLIGVELTDPPAVADGEVAAEDPPVSTGTSTSPRSRAASSKRPSKKAATRSS